MVICPVLMMSPSYRNRIFSITGNIKVGQGRFTKCISQVFDRGPDMIPVLKRLKLQTLQLLEPSKAPKHEHESQAHNNTECYLAISSARHAVGLCSGLDVLGSLV